MLDLKNLISKIEQFKYPLLILAIGVILMLIPSGEITNAASSDSNSLAEDILACTEGVGDVRVLISDNGVVVVCRGAGNASVRLNIVKAISAYTGFNSDKITILKMTE